MTNNTITIIPFDDIEGAYHRISPYHQRTPLLTSPLLNKKLGREIYIKPESLQKTGAFKFRGALNKILSDEAKGVKNIVAYSSGNHGQAVAAVSAILGLQADIIMPSDAPLIKQNLTRNWGAKIHLYDRVNESREEIGKKIAAQKKSLLIPPYDDIGVITGQGTIGYEILEDCEKLNINDASIILPCGGGGVCAGVASAIKGKRPNFNIFIAEPDNGYDDVLRSLKSGKREKITKQSPHICDAIVTPSPGLITFPIIKNLVSGGSAVSQQDVFMGIAILFKYFKIVAEPGGVAAFASVMKSLLFNNSSGKDAQKTSGPIIVVISGGNIDPALFAEILQKTDIDEIEKNAKI